VILGIDHVGVVVSNLDKARSRFAAILGRESGHSELVASHGVHVAFAPHGWQMASEAALEVGSLIGAPQAGAGVLSDGTRLEFLEPVDETSAVGRFLARRGEGLHHVCFVTDDIGAELERLRPDFDLIDDVPRRGHGGLVAFLHPKQSHGVLVELLQRDPATPGAFSHTADPSEPVSAVADTGSQEVAGRVATAGPVDDKSVTLLELARAGDRRALARVLTIVETGSPSAGTLVHNARQALLGTGFVAKRTRVIGITGAPGAGKSTLVGALARSMRRADPDHRIAVLAIDPSNPFTRGALLGDRIRMPEASGDDGIFIRSVAGRGSGDGLSRSAGEMLAVLQYVGFDTVLLETVGAGQDELAVGALADTVIVVFAPGLGDGIQALKAGLLDLAQIVVVNKADLDGAAALASQLAFGRNDSVTIVATTSTTGSGIDELREAIAQCANDTGPVQSSRHQLVTSSIVQTAVDQFRASLLGAIDGNPLWADTIGQVQRREMSVDEAARRFLAGVLKAEI
jgi:LAO/AO transport system kinase